MIEKKLLSFSFNLTLMVMEIKVCVIPIVGIGELGKTTLAKLVFNDQRIDELFQLKMWVCVSNDFDNRQIIIKIINSLSASAPTISLAYQENINSFDTEQLQSSLRQELMKVGAMGSKIIVTTRSNSVATMMGTVPSYVLKGLSMENCLSLFVKWAFKEGEEKKYPNLVEMGKEIMKKCRGVPLAVRIVGSSLFLNFDLERWEFVRNHDLWNLKQKKDDILPALKLSYDQMPSYLRHSFAYFPIFPKDFCFTDAHFVNIWGSLGLLRSTAGSQKLENIAKQYISELHSRSFLEDFEDFGQIYYFKLHDLGHDLALHVAKEELQVINSRTRNIREQVRHLSVIENDSLSNALFPMSRNVRTILFPIDGMGVNSEALMHTWIARFKYLRLLDLSDFSFETPPNSIANLEHLQLLSLTNNCKIKRLPPSICKLQNLQLLSLRGCTKLETLPKGFGKLISLRKLFITTKQSTLSEEEFVSLSNLQSLSFEYCNNLKFLFRQTQLTSLEVLAIQSCGSLESLPLHILPKLDVLFIIRCEMLNLSLNCESRIHRLRIKFLHLAYCPRLQTLPQWIEGAAETLQTLLVSNCHNLETLPEWLTTKTHLKMLHMVNCPLLFHLPSDMHRLSALEDLSLDGCPELCRKCQPQSGECWSFISHIKRLSIGEIRESQPLPRMLSRLRLQDQ